MTTNLAHIADRVLNRPLLILPDKLALISRVLSGRIGIDASGLAPDASRFVGSARQGEPYRLTRDGVAIVTITGSLVNRGAWINSQSGLTSYEGITHQLTIAARDSRVKSIVLDLDSPGGEATGAFETAALVRKISKAKPIYAVVNGMAASAAYAIASAAKAIISTESAMSGSIGVVLMHADYSRAIDRAGITPTLIHAGARKVDGNPYQPLPKTVRADLQKEVNAFYKMFLSTVAAGRGSRLTAAAAKATEARTFIGRDALKVGLVDAIGSFDELLTNLSKTPASSSQKGKTLMALNPDIFSDGYADQFAEPAAAAATATKAEIDDAFMRGKIAGASAERARIGALLSLPTAQADLKAAVAYVLSPGSSAEGLTTGINAARETRQAEIDASWDDTRKRIAGESKTTLTDTSAPAQPGALSIDDLAARLNGAG